MPYYERNLPHWLPAGKHLFVTWRLYGSLPAVTVATLRKTDDLKDGKRFRFIDQELDGAAFGPVCLRDPRMAKIVVAAMDAVAHAGLCPIHAFVVMPNHLHPLLEPKVDLKRLMRGIKGRSARAGNLALKRTGERFWQEESCDRWIGNPSLFEKIRTYIERNPVSAALANTPKEWQWSSAFRYHWLQPLWSSVVK